MAKSEVGLPEGFSLKVSKEDLEGPASISDYLDSDPLLEQLKKAAQKPKENREIISPFKNIEAAKAEERALEEKRAAERAASERVMAERAEAEKLEQQRFEEAREKRRLEALKAASLSLSGPVSSAPQGRTENLEASASPQALSQSVFSAPQSLGQEERVGEEYQRKYKKRPHGPVPRRLQLNLSPEGERKLSELYELINAQSPEKVMISDIMQALVFNLFEAKGDLNVSRLSPRGPWGSPTARSFTSALAQTFREAVVTYNVKQGGNPFKKVVGE
jgi:hypothetical protein